MSSIFNLLDSNSTKDDPEYPEGISDENASGKAYKAMFKVKESKIDYIRSHSKKTDFRTEKSYLVQRQEVSNIVGVKVQTLFNTSTYSKILSDQWKQINEELKALVEKKIATKETRTKAKSKSEIYKENQNLKAKIKQLEEQKAADNINACIEKMSLKAKKLMLP
jgi:hypothetical protein